jgi:DNA-directed RNA polymerase sigma subunit (sigma70/sigma32)
MQKRGSEHPNWRGIPNRTQLAMLRLLESGWTLQSVGNKFGVSRQRVHQIRQRYGARYKHGG